MQLDQATTEDRIGLLWEWVKVALNVGSMVAFILEQAFGPEDGLIVNGIPTPDLIENVMLCLLNAISLICLVMGVMSALLFMILNGRQREGLNQIVDHMYSNALAFEQNTEEIQRELDLKESTRGRVKRIEANLDSHKASIKDLDHAALGWEAIQQLCIQLSNERLDLAHKLCQVQVKNKLC